MIGMTVTKDKDGEPVDSQGNKLSPSEYNPPEEIKKLFALCQQDYGVAYGLQHRSFDEFDGISLLDRARVDQQTFGAYVGAEFVPGHMRWRWKGRKNTARNKLIGILAHMLVAMLFPYVKAVNDRNEEDKMAARVMAIMVENYLKRAKYEMKFLYIVLSALVNPAAFVQIQYIEAMQRIKSRLADGTIEIIEAVDELVSGLQMHILRVDELMLADFYTPDLQSQPYLIRVRRIAWDEARKIYGHNPNFKYVEAGKTRIVITGNENQTLYDIDWTEADRDYVQELTFYYRQEDLEVTWVGGVFMGNETDPYNSNPFKHRRLVQYKKEWVSAPVYPFAKTGFEPIDPTGNFAYYKSGAFKEYWDDASQNKMHQLLHDGTYLDVIKPIFLSGIGKLDSAAMVPGATIGMPMGAKAEPYSIGPNLSAAAELMNIEKSDMAESTQDKIMSGGVEANVTAYATQQAEQNARIFLGVFGNMLASLVKDVGELTMDCILQHATVGDVAENVEGRVGLNLKTFVMEGKDKGQKVTNRIVFTDKYMGKKMTEKQIEQASWKLYKKAGGDKTDQRIYEVNPYLFARTSYAFSVDPDQIIRKSSGTEEQRKILAWQMFKDPDARPYIDMEAAVEDFVIEPFAEGDPERYRAKGNVNDMMQGVMGPMGQGAPPVPGVPNAVPSPLPPNSVTR